MSETNCCSVASISAPARRRPRPSRRWLGLAALLVLCLGLVAWIEVGTWRQMQDLKTDFYDANLEGFQLGLRLREGLERMNGALFRFQLSGEDEERTLFERESNEISTMIQKAKGQLQTDGERRLVAEIEQAYREYVTGSERYLQRGLRGIRKDTASLVHHELETRSAGLVALAQRLVELQRGALTRFFGSAGSALGSLQNVLVVSVLLLVLLVVTVAALMSRALIAPLRAELDARQVIIQRQEKLASLGVLAAGVAHEIRNPLLAIKFRLFSLKSALPEGLEFNEDAVVIGNELNRLDRIVREFLQFARPSEPELAEVSVRPILQEVQGLLGSELASRGVTLRVDVPVDLRIRADRQQVQQVLINLVQNAADSISGPGAVTVRANDAAASGSRDGRAAASSVVLEVTDTGSGIPPDVERRIFDPFFSTKEGGTGLGLAIASRIMEKHGGVIQYTTQPQRGTTFSLTFPCLQPNESAIAPDRR